jgi:ATP-dependent protease ClpP protease subunit
MIFTIKNIIIISFISCFFYKNIISYFQSLNEYYQYRHVNLLYKNNNIIINGEINCYSINRTIILLKKKTKFNNIDIKIDPTINLIINSNGGDYLYGYKLIVLMNNLKKQKIKFNCYAYNAFSTAFTIFQYCNKRYVIPTSILYQHNATINFKGSFEQFRNFYETKFQKYSNIYSENTKYIANKIGLSYTNYIKKINKDWKVVGGNNIIKNKLADEIVILPNKNILIK